MLASFAERIGEKAMAGWRIAGEYMETCNCAFLCPCITSNLTAPPTEGDCKAALALRIDRGQKDAVTLDGLSFIVVLHSPGAMVDGNITVGLIVDDRASDEQAAAIAAIATGAAGGPMAALAPLVGRVAGVERRPIEFSIDGLTRTVKAGELIDESCVGVASAADANQALALDNLAHPVNSRLSLAKAARSVFSAFGIDWKDESGSRNGHFAPFSWAA
jgi:hypothetical protein